jgi:hypothetical protein
LVAFAPGGVVLKEKKIVRAFGATGATSPDGATTAAAIGVREGLAFRILCRRAVLRDAGERRFYLDEPSWEALCAMRRKLAIIAVLAALAAVGVVLASSKQ